MSVAEFPDDPFLPTLADVLRRAVAESLLGGMVPGLASGGGTSGYRAVVVHHPREGACVLRFELAGAEVYAKVYPLPEDASAAADALGAVGAREVVAPGSDVVRLPGVLGVSTALRTTFLESLAPRRSLRRPHWRSRARQPGGGRACPPCTPHAHAFGPPAPAAGQGAREPGPT